MEIKKKSYSDSFKGYYVWILMNLQYEILYVGMTTNYYKILANHLSGNVKSTKKFIKKGNYIIKYLDLGQYIEDKQELKYIKNILLDLYDPELNSRRNVIKGMDP